MDYVFFAVKSVEVRESDAAAIVDFAAIRANARGHVLAAYSDRVRPSREVSASSLASEGYSTAALASALSLAAVLDNACRLVLTGEPSETTCIAHHAELVRAALAREVLGAAPWGFLRGPWECTARMAFPLVWSGQTGERRALAALARHLETPMPAKGEASADATSTMGVFFALMRRYRAGLFAEETARLVGGEKLDKVRRFLGV